MMDDGLSKSKSVYLFTERQLPSPAETTGATNLLDQHGLSKAYEKYCNKKALGQFGACFDTLNFGLKYLTPIKGKRNTFAFFT